MLAVRTNPECTWTATSGAPWISLSPASGQGSASVELRVTPNDGSAQREGNINVNDEQIRVSQRAPCRFEIAPATHTMTTAGGSGRVTVSTLSDCAWAATTDVGWISLIAPLSGSGNGTVSFTVAANSGQARTGNVVIAGQRSTVTQAAVVRAVADATVAGTATRHPAPSPFRRPVRTSVRAAVPALSPFPHRAVARGRQPAVRRGSPSRRDRSGREAARWRSRSEPTPAGTHRQPDHCWTHVHRVAGGALHVRPLEGGRDSARERGLCLRERHDDERLRVDGHQQQLVADHPVRIRRYRQWPGDVQHSREHRRSADRLPHSGWTSLQSRTRRAIAARTNASRRFPRVDANLIRTGEQERQLVVEPIALPETHRHDWHDAAPLMSPGRAAVG